MYQYVPYPPPQKNFENRPICGSFFFGCLVGPRVREARAETEDRFL